MRQINFQWTRNKQKEEAGKLPPANGSPCGQWAILGSCGHGTPCPHRAGSAGCRGLLLHSVVCPCQKCTHCLYAMARGTLPEPCAAATTRAGAAKGMSHLYRAHKIHHMLLHKAGVWVDMRTQLFQATTNLGFRSNNSEVKKIKYNTIMTSPLNKNS